MLPHAHSQVDSGYLSNRVQSISIMVDRLSLHTSNKIACDGLRLRLLRTGRTCTFYRSLFRRRWWALGHLSRDEGDSGLLVPGHFPKRLGREWAFLGRLFLSSVSRRHDSDEVSRYFSVGQ